jgi:hypothetical protein
MGHNSMICSGKPRDYDWLNSQFRPCVMYPDIMLSLSHQIRSGASTIEDFAGLGSRCSEVGK